MEESSQQGRGGMLEAQPSCLKACMERAGQGGTTKLEFGDLGSEKGLSEWDFEMGFKNLYFKLAE